MQENGNIENGKKGEKRGNGKNEKYDHNKHHGLAVVVLIVVVVVVVVVVALCTHVHIAQQHQRAFNHTPADACWPLGWLVVHGKLMACHSRNELASPGLAESSVASGMPLAAAMEAHVSPGSVV